MSFRIQQIKKEKDGKVFSIGDKIFWKKNNDNGKILCEIVDIFINLSSFIQLDLKKLDSEEKTKIFSINLNEYDIDKLEPEIKNVSCNLIKNNFRNFYLKEYYDEKGYTFIEKNENFSLPKVPPYGFKVEKIKRKSDGKIFKRGNIIALYNNEMNINSFDIIDDIFLYFSNDVNGSKQSSLQIILYNKNLKESCIDLMEKIDIHDLHEQAGIAPHINDIVKEEDKGRDSIIFLINKANKKLLNKYD